MTRRAAVLLFVAFAATTAVLLWRFAIIHWAQNEFGFRNGDGNSPHYLFWSGIGSDLAYLSIVGALLGVVRSHNCEVHGCWRIGRHATAAGTKVCRKHHPDGHLTEEDVLKAHHFYLGKRPGRG
jgi:hypothetical protein